MTQEKKEEIISRFTNHIPDQATIEKMATLRSQIRQLAYLIEEMCPISREKNTALTHLSFVMMSANSAIVQRCPVNKSDLVAYDNLVETNVGMGREFMRPEDC